MKKSDPSYYSILPADVRYDVRVSAGAKILFSEVTALCNKSGKCWASNAYFAKLYSVTNKTVSLWLTELKDNGYVDTVTEDNQRIITITKRCIPLNENVMTPLQKGDAPHNKKVKQNNTSINTKSNTYIQKAVAIYSAFWKDLYGFDYEMTNWGRLGKALKPLDKLNEWQIATLIWLHFNWFGASGDDKKTNKYLADKGFPLEWIPNNLSIYKAYLINSLNVSWDDEQAVKKFILPDLKKINYEVIA